MAVDPTLSPAIDLSKWNGRYNPNAKGVDFCIIKASDGWARDPAFIQLLQDAAPVPIAYECVSARWPPMFEPVVTVIDLIETGSDAPASSSAYASPVVRVSGVLRPTL